MSAITKHKPEADSRVLPPLHNGDRLTQAEFHRRYEAYPKMLSSS